MSPPKRKKGRKSLVSGASKPASGISLTEFAQRDGCAGSLVYRALERGYLKRLLDGSLDPALVGTAWRRGNEPTDADLARLAEGAIEPGEAPEAAADRLLLALATRYPTRADAEKVKATYLALLRKLEYDRETGKVVLITDVAKVVAAEYSRVKSILGGISTTVAPKVLLAKTAAEVKAIIDREINEALRELTQDAA